MLYIWEFAATTDPSEVMYEPTIIGVSEANAFVGLKVSDFAASCNSSNSSSACCNSAALSTPLL